MKFQGKASKHRINGFALLWGDGKGSKHKSFSRVDPLPLAAITAAILTLCLVPTTTQAAVTSPASTASVSLVSSFAPKTTKSFWVSASNNNSKVKQGTELLVVRKRGRREQLLANKKVPKNGSVSFVVKTDKKSQDQKLILRVKLVLRKHVLSASKWQTVDLTKRRIHKSPRILIPKAAGIVSLPPAGQKGQMVLKGKQTAPVNSFVAMGISSATPHGFLVKVVGASYKNGNTVLDTEPGLITEAVPSGSFDVSLDSGAASGAATSRVAHVAKTIPSPPEEPVNGSASDCSSGGKLNVDGSLGFTNQNADLSGDWSWWNLVTGSNPVKSISFTTSLTAKADLSATADVKGTCSIPTAKLATVHIGDVLFAIGEVPVEITFQLRFVLDASVHAKGLITAKLKGSLNATAGVTYKGGKFTPNGGLNPGLHSNPPETNVGAGIEASVTSSLDALFYGVAGPAVDLSTGLALDVNPTNESFWELYAPLDLGVSFNAPVFDLFSGTLSLWHHDYSIASSEPPLIGPPAPMSPPSNTSPPVITGTLMSGETLSTSDGTWSSENPLMLTYQWLSCDVNTATCGNIQGARSSTYPLLQSDVGKRIEASVTATNGNGDAATVVSAPSGVVVSAPVPANLTAPVVTGIPSPGHVLTTTDGTWSGNPTWIYYFWERCDANDSNCDGIANEFDNTYTPTTGDVGHVIHAIVRATNIAGNSTAVSNPSTISNVLPGELTAGFDHSCALLSTGAVCWGSNDRGQLGDGTTAGKNTPTAVSGLSSGVTAISAGNDHTCALLSTGAVKCWGYNGYGQIGDGTTTDKTTPTDVSGLSGVSAITAGGFYTCALLSTGAVKCWGNNAVGQLGDGTQADKATPTDVSGLSSGVSAITAGSYYTCALLSNGAVKCWGSNQYGQLGDGTTIGKATPTDVSGLSSGVTAIISGGDHTCALLTTGAVKCWGWNDFGQLGDGTTTDKNTPTDVSGLSSGVTAITAGGDGFGDHTCALLTTGAVKCWGYNSWGQLGDGTTADKTTPTDVSGLSGVSAITAGARHTCALLSNGAVKCWGRNFWGQIGDGTFVDKATPTDVSGIP